MTGRSRGAVAAEAARLVMRERWAALATVDESGGPSGSMVAYAPEPGLRSVLLFLSGLASHTRHAAATGRCALVIGAPDDGVGDPQTLPRVSLDCAATVIGRGDPAFASAWQVYVSRFPDAASRLALGDFDLFRLEIVSARHVGGFARAATLSADDLAAAGGGGSPDRPVA